MDATELHRIGRQAWPTIDLAVDVLAAHVAALDDVSPEWAAELYLACACARGDGRAVAALERTYFADVRAAVARVTPDAATAEDALQLLREKLLVGRADKPPGIAGYAGRGDLRAWLKIAATRVALGLLRGRRPDGEAGELAQVTAPDADPELALLRQQYGAEANAALRDAFAELEARDRNLLRQHFVDGFSIDRLGELYGIHRATAARRIEKARTALEKRTRRLLMSRLRIGASTLDSLVAMLQSELHLSLNGD